MEDNLIHKSPEPLTLEYFKLYFNLAKMRLSISVVGTSVISYFLGLHKTGISFHLLTFFGLVIGGMLVVIASNAFNQIIEKDTDKLMNRTSERPVASGRLSQNDALWFASICAILGLLTLVMLTNKRVAVFSLLSIFSYVLVYTPMKKVSPMAVFIGAFPGAIPASMGWVCVTQNIDEIAILLFIIQFFWQFPHFWSIAWILEDDYRKAGYTLLPNYEGRTSKNSLKIMLYSVFTVIISIYPLFNVNIFSLKSLFIIIPISVLLIWASVKLQKNLDIKSAKQLLYVTLIYMPLVLLSYFL